MSITSTGLPARPRTPEVNTKPDGVFVALRTSITGVVSNNVTLVFEVQAKNINTSRTITKNFTITEYISNSDVLREIKGLTGGNYYTFRSRVFNIYGASEFSSSTAAVFISKSQVYRS